MAGMHRSARPSRFPLPYRLLLGLLLALVVAVASAHRTEAFEACRAVVEDIKAEVPIWKRQHTASGDARWVGLP